MKPKRQSGQANDGKNKRSIPYGVGMFADEPYCFIWPERDKRVQNEPKTSK